MNLRKITRLLPLLCLFALFACGGGGSSGGGDDPGDDTNVTDPINDPDSGDDPDVTDPTTDLDAGDDTDVTDPTTDPDSGGDSSADPDDAEETLDEVVDRVAEELGYTRTTNDAGQTAMRSADWKLSLLRNAQVELQSGKTDVDGKFSVDVYDDNGQGGQQLYLLGVTNGEIVGSTLSRVSQVEMLSIIDYPTLVNGNVTVNILTDVIARTLTPYWELLNSSEIVPYLDQLATELVLLDMNADGEVDYSDVLDFDSSNPDHLASLTFNYSDKLDTVQFAGENSLFEKYTTENSSVLYEGIEEAFGELLDIGLPDPDDIEKVVLTVTVDGLDGILSFVDPEYGEEMSLVPQLGEYKLILPRSDSATHTFTLEIDDDLYRLYGWQGCDNAKNISLTCTVTLDEDKTVSPRIIFDRNVVKADISFIDPFDTENPRTVEDEISPRNTESLTGLGYEIIATPIDNGSDVASYDIRLLVDSSSSVGGTIPSLLAEGAYFNTGIVALPLIRIDQVSQQPTVVQNGKSVLQYSVTATEAIVTDIYDVYSTTAMFKATTPDDVTSLEVIDENTGELTTVILPSPANRLSTDNNVFDLSPEAESCFEGETVVLSPFLQPMCIDSSTPIVADPEQCLSYADGAGYPGEQIYGGHTLCEIFPVDDYPGKACLIEAEETGEFIEGCLEKTLGCTDEDSCPAVVLECDVANDPEGCEEELLACVFETGVGTNTVCDDADLPPFSILSLISDQDDDLPIDGDGIPDDDFEDEFIPTEDDIDGDGVPDDTPTDCVALEFGETSCAPEEFGATPRAKTAPPPTVLARKVWVSGYGEGYYLGSDKVFVHDASTGKNLIVESQDGVKELDIPTTRRYLADLCYTDPLAKDCELIKGRSSEKQLSLEAIVPRRGSFSSSIEITRGLLTVGVGFTLEVNSSLHMGVDYNFWNQRLKISANGKMDLTPGLTQKIALGQTETFERVGNRRNRKSSQRTIATAQKIAGIDITSAMTPAGAVIRAGVDNYVGIDAGGSIELSLAEQLRIVSNINGSILYDINTCSRSVLRSVDSRWFGSKIFKKVKRAVRRTLRWVKIPYACVTSSK